MTAAFLVGDVHQRQAELIADGEKFDLIITSPPFYNLRSYLSDDHPDKHLEIGSEQTPADWLDTMLAVTAQWRRLLAPHGSIAIELGDTYANSGGAGGDYNPDGLRDGQQRFRQANGTNDFLAKSLLGIPHAYMLSLILGRNIYRNPAPPSPAGQWRIRNLKPWIRTNPPVGALGDKERPATSYITVATLARDRWFDLDSARHGTPRPPLDWYHTIDAIIDNELQGENGEGKRRGHHIRKALERAGILTTLDAHDISPSGYSGSHYAVFPMELVRQLVDEMCPRRVCVECGEPSRRLGQAAAFGRQPELAAHIKERREALGITSAEVNGWFGYKEIAKNWERLDRFGAAVPSARDWPTLKERLKLSDDFDDFVMSRDRTVVEYEGERRQDYGRGGHAEINHTQVNRPVVNRWSDCGHNTWRPGRILDPFVGSGTTLAVATGMARDAVGIDLDARNAHLAEQRCGMFLTVDWGNQEPTDELPPPEIVAAVNEELL